MDKVSLKGIAAATLMSIFIGLQFYFIKSLMNIFENRVFSFLALRFLLAAVILLPVCALKKISLKKFLNLKLMLLSLLLPILNLTFQTFGVKLSSVTSVGYISSLGPVITLAVSAVVLKTKPTARQIFAITAAFAGAALIYFGKNAEVRLDMGALLIFAALLFRSLYAALSRTTAKSCTPLELTAVQIFWGLVFFAAAFVWENRGLSLSNMAALIKPMGAKGWINLLYVSLISLDAVYLLNNYSLSEISVAASGVMSNLTFVVTLLSGVFLLSEKINAWAIVGSALIAFGVIFMNLGQKKNNG